jgi:arsenate reductase (glutaredoxin)
MIKVYGIPNCNTVKKAIDWLKQNNLQYEFHDYKKLGITKDKLKEWSKHFGWENVLNKKGTTWAELTNEEKAVVTNEKAAINLMVDKTSSIKRPIIEANGKYLIRFNEEEYKDVLL